MRRPLWLVHQQRDIEEAIAIAEAWTPPGSQ
jgi:hypothetical protein